MKQAQYTIMRINDGFQALWCKKVILFDTQEEAEEFIETFPKFFGIKNFEIKKGIYYIDSSINYKDLKEQEDYKLELTKEKNMARTLQEVLDTDLSPDNLWRYTPNELTVFLVENGIVKTTEDVKRLIVEGIQRALNEDDEFPIHYYTKDEPMSEDGKVANVGPCLTDEYIENEMNP